MPRTGWQLTPALLLGAVALAGCGSSGAAGATGAAAPTATAPTPVVDISAAGGDQVNPTTPISVRVSNGRLSTVTVTNPSGKQVSGGMSTDATSWQTSEPLGYDTYYAVTATAVGMGGQTTQQHKTIHTLAPRTQTYPRLTPVPNTGITFGVGEPIVVSFDEKITDRAAAERALQVTATPQQPGGWYWVSDREVHYRPKDYWQPGTKVSVKVHIYGVDLGNGVYGQTDRVLDFTVHDSWIAKADGNTAQMQIFHNGQMLRSMPISMGKDSTPTHVGPHVISDKQPKVTMDSCTYGLCPPDPNAYREDEFFDERISADGEFVHENPASAAQQGRANVSHGCINLNRENAEWFYQNFGLGDVVEVTNSGGPPLPISDTFGDWEIPWSTWQAGSALS
jgi:lipoprotein-anchoring transpeptidase ErfK/SrfK